MKHLADPLRIASACLERDCHFIAMSPPGLGKTVALSRLLAGTGRQIEWIPISPELEGPELVVALKIPDEEGGTHRGALYRAACTAREGRRVIVRATEIQHASTSTLGYLGQLSDQSGALRTPLGEVIRFAPELLLVVLEGNPPWRAPAWIQDRFAKIIVDAPDLADIRGLLAESLATDEVNVVMRWYETRPQKPSLRRLGLFLRLAPVLGMESAAAATLAEPGDEALLPTLAALFPHRKAS